MMKAVAYYRSRPNEPEASDLAMRRQREAVRKDVEEGGLDLVAEFIEREGEAGSEAYPAYVAAVHAASAHNCAEGFVDVMLIIATQAAIGSGQPFAEPEVKSGGGFMMFWLQVSSIPEPPEIVLPSGAPGPLCLYADYRPRQLDTLIYVCNAGPEALAEVMVTTSAISMNEFFSTKRGEEPWTEGRTCEQRWDVLLPGVGVMVTSLNHCICDYVTRYRLAYTDRAGQRWTTETHDLNLSACNLSEGLDKPWVAFCQSRKVA